MKFSTGIVILCILLNMAFTLGVFLAASYDHVIPDSLIIAFFGFTSGELAMLTSIKKAKVKKLRRYSDDEKRD